VPLFKNPFSSPYQGEGDTGGEALRKPFDKMWKTFKYAFLTCALAYLMATLLLIIYHAVLGRFEPFMDSLTWTWMLPHVSRWWSDFYYLRFFAPWLFSSLVLVLLLYLFKGETRRRRLLSGFSVAAYYVVMLLVYIVDNLVTWWGHIIPPDFLDILYYLEFLVWPAVGFGLGYLAAFIVERIWKPKFAV
jgi:hypothetical protein